MSEIIDLHGKNKYQAKITLDSALRKARSGVYRIKVIHGYNLGIALRNYIREEYQGHPKVLRIETSGNNGETILVLRELY